MSTILEDLHLPDEAVAALRAGLRAPGLTLVSGRYGTGKSRAALTAAAEAADGNRSVITIEDAPEGDVPGLVRLTPTGERPFAALARRLSQTDADVILVDEVLDIARAEFALRHASAGRSVLAVITSTSALAAIDRFADDASRDYGTELGVYSALRSVVHLRSDERDAEVFVNSDAATRALLAGRPSAEVRAAAGAGSRFRD